MQQNKGMTYPADEISLLDVVAFLVRYWKLIATTFIIGLALAFTYLAVAPKRYEAYGYVQLSQVLQVASANRLEEDSIADLDKLNNVNPEPRAVLAEQFQLPTAYAAATVEACGAGSAEGMPGMVRIVPSRTAASVVEIIVGARSPEQATRCVDAVFQQISTEQQKQMQPYRASITRLTKDVETRYQENLALAEKLEKAGISQGLYLVRRDNAILLRKQLELMRRMQAFDGTPRLLAPAYASARPIAPVRSRVIVFGAMSGLLLGMALAIAQVLYRKMRARSLQA